MDETIEGYRKQLDSLYAVLENLEEDFQILGQTVDMSSVTNAMASLISTGQTLAASLAAQVQALSRVNL